jgi:hypothetical protein
MIWVVSWPNMFVYCMVNPHAYHARLMALCLKVVTADGDVDVVSVATADVDVDGVSVATDDVDVDVVKLLLMM